MNVIFQYGAGPWLREQLANLAEHGLAVEPCDEEDDARFFALLSVAEVIWHVLKPISADVIARAPKLRLIQKIGVGVNTIDLDAARARRIPVCNMPGTNSRAVAEMTLLLMLAALRRLPLLALALRSGIPRVHVDAKRAAVDLRVARLHKVDQRRLEAATLDVALEGAERLHRLGRSLVRVQSRLHDRPPRVTGVARFTSATP